MAPCSRNRWASRPPGLSIVCRKIPEHPAEREHALLDQDRHLADICQGLAALVEYPGLPKERLLLPGDFVLVGRGLAHQPVELRRLGADAFGKGLLLAGIAADAVDDVGAVEAQPRPVEEREDLRPVDDEDDADDVDLDDRGVGGDDDDVCDIFIVGK